jgi:DNA-directed RNA polymerase subunit N (RpoN/RPB10)
MAKEYIKDFTCGLKVGNRFLTILQWISIAREPSDSLDGLTL